MNIQAFLVIGLLQLVAGANYYPYGNPCATDIPYDSSTDVLNNLSSYSALYVKYEGCTYSSQSTNGNGGGGGGDEDWYMGFNVARGANIAYSLYGVKSDSLFKLGACSKSTFINSFYTMDGLTSFLSSAGLTLTDYYNYGNNNNERRLEEDENGSCTDALYCASNNQFVEAAFTDGYCTPSEFAYVLDPLDSLNSALSNQSCLKIYDASSGTDYASTLLYYSQTCTAKDGASCPDRYKKLAKCEEKFQEMNTYLKRNGKDPNIPIRYVFGSVFYAVTLGIIIYLLMKRRSKRVDNSYVNKSYVSPNESISEATTSDSFIPAASAPSRTLSIQSVAESIAASVKGVKEALTTSSMDDVKLNEPIVADSSMESNPPEKKKKKGPFAFIRRSRK